MTTREDRALSPGETLDVLARIRARMGPVAPKSMPRVRRPRYSPDRLRALAMIRDAILDQARACDDVETKS